MNEVTIDFSSSKGRISPDLYGHFSEHIGGVFYDGLWVGEDSPVEQVHGFRKALVESFRKLNPPVLRWPGGCFAETYDWRDGIGPRASRPHRMNWWYSHDHRAETNQVGTHEFVDFCRLTGAKPYFAANMTSTTPLHIRDWVEYCNVAAGETTLADERAKNGAQAPFDVRLWGIGNENWGGGGEMTPEQCAREYIRYTTVINSLSGGKLQFILCGASGADLDWTRRILREYTRQPRHYAPTYGMSIHYYCGGAGTATEYSEAEWYRLLRNADRIGEIMDEHRAAMDEFDPERKMKLIVDEWGCWHPEGSGPSKGKNLFEQQSTLRDAQVTAMTLNAFNNRCDFVDMANVAQLCNNLHSLYLAAGEQFVETPNYFVYDMYKGHMGARQLKVKNDCGEWAAGERPLPRLSASASQAEDGSVLITLANASMTEALRFTLGGADGRVTGEAECTVLSHADVHACNTFERPDEVRPRAEKKTLGAGEALEIPAGGVMAIHILA